MGLKAKAKEFMLNQAINRMMDLASSGDPDRNLRRIINVAEKITTDPLWVDAINGFKYRLDINHPLMEIARRFMRDFNPNVRRKIIRNLVVKETLVGADKRHKIEHDIGFYPPTLFVISPTMACNIKCEGCYAERYTKKHQMSYDTFDDILQQAKDMGIHFVVVSGGGRGVTAHCVIELARATKAAFVLLGRTPLADEPACVAGIENACDVLKDGQVVEVDGANGIVRLVA